MEGSLYVLYIHFVSKWKGLCPLIYVLFVLKSIGQWSDQGLGRWMALESGKRVTQSEVTWALFIRVLMICPFGHLFVQVKERPM